MALTKRSTASVWTIFEKRMSIYYGIEKIAYENKSIRDMEWFSLAEPTLHTILYARKERIRNEERDSSNKFKWDTAGRLNKEAMKEVWRQLNKMKEMEDICNKPYKEWRGSEWNRLFTVISVKYEKCRREELKRKFLGNPIN